MEATAMLIFLLAMIGFEALAYWLKDNFYMVLMAQLISASFMYIVFTWLGWF